MSEPASKASKPTKPPSRASVSAKIRAISAAKTESKRQRLTDEADEEFIALFTKMDINAKKTPAGAKSDFCKCKGAKGSTTCCETKTCGCHKQERPCLPDCGCQKNEKECKNPAGVEEYEENEENNAGEPAEHVEHKVVAEERRPHLFDNGCVRFRYERFDDQCNMYYDVKFIDVVSKKVEWVDGMLEDPHQYAIDPLWRIRSAYFDSVWIPSNPMFVNEGRGMECYLDTGFPCYLRFKN